MKYAFPKIAFMLILLATFPGFAELIDSYPSYEEMVAEIHELRDADPDRVELVEYGKSVEGRPLLALRIHLADGEDRSAALVAANIHGNEWIGNRAAMAISWHVVSGMDSDPLIRELLGKMDIYVAPCLNPDGYYRTWKSGGNDTQAEMRKNANGVDLNRNFPVSGKKTPKGDFESMNYPGEAPFSEPETRAIRDLVIGRGIFATVDFHSPLFSVITPGCRTPECRQRYKAMVKAYRSNQKGVKYPGLVSYDWLETPGMMEPYLYFYHGVMSICVEFGVVPVIAAKKGSLDFFDSLNPGDHEKWANHEINATLKALEEAYQLTGGKPIPEELR